MRINKIYLLLGFFLLLLLFLSSIYPYDPLRENLNEVLLPPSTGHLLGTDNIGRDIFSRIVFGFKLSLVFGLLGALSSTFCGFFLGVISGYFGGIIDLVIMAFVDIMLAFPSLIFAIAIAAALGSGIYPLLLTITVSTFAPIVRLVRSQCLSLKESTFIESSRALGNSDFRIITFHLLTNLTGLFIVIFSNQIGNIILIESSLNFLGLGISPPTPTLGSMVFYAMSYLRLAPWWGLSAGFTIAILVVFFNLSGDIFNK
jgi:peptide/nickel transport system permease protein